MSIEPTGTSFDYYIGGIKYTAEDPITEIITDTEGLWVFYLDSEDSITSVNNPSHTQIGTVIDDYANAIGGTKALKKVKTISQDYTMQMGP